VVLNLKLAWCFRDGIITDTISSGLFSRLLGEYLGGGDMKTHHRIYIILFTCLIGISIVGCSESPLPPELMDRSPFSGTPCEAPCWHGLTIGESNENEVMEILPTLAFINQDTIFVHYMSMPGPDPSIFAPGAEITASCIRPHKPCLTLRVVDDVLIEIQIVLNYDITLEDAIASLGNPDYLGYQFQGMDLVKCDVEFVWRNRQLILLSDTFVGAEVDSNCGVVRDTGMTVPGIMISEVRYMLPYSINLLLSNDMGEFFGYSSTIP
jgi:hypothetical protein